MVRVGVLGALGILVPSLRSTLRVSMLNNNTNIDAYSVVTRPECGTRAGYVRHYKNKEQKCEPCLKANRVYQAEFRKKKWVPFEERKTPSIRPQCGSPRGRDLHAYHGELSCEACRIAGNARIQESDEKNSEQRWKRSRKWHLENPDLSKQAGKKWRLNNPDKIRAKNRRQRAVRLDAETENYTEDLVLNIYGVNCHICSKEIDLAAPRRVGLDGWENGLHIDHLVALSKGGTNLIENVRPAHALCNVKKGGR